jgi:hypothetical protein
MTKKKVRMNGPMNDLMTSRCSFFTPNPNCICEIYRYKVNLF